MSKTAEELAVKSLYRILQNTHTKSDLFSLTRSLKTVEGLSELSDFVHKTYPKVVQNGEKNVCIQSADSVKIELQGVKYTEEETKFIASEICEFIGKQIESSLKEGLNKRSAPNYIKEEHESSEGLSIRHLTCVNEYSVLAFIQACFPKTVTDVLGIENTPIVLDTVVLDSLRKFVRESGNEWLLYEILSEMASVKYSINSTGITNQGLSGRSGRVGNRQVFTQSKRDFESESLEYRHEKIDFGYTPVYADFPAKSSEFQNTTFIPSFSLNTPARFLYYPSLQEIFSHYDSAQIYQYSYGSIEGRDEWIMKVLESDPNLRGLILFEYKAFQDKRSKSLLAGCGSGLPKGVSCIAPTLYLRFADISNTSQKNIYLGTLNLQASINPSHKITVVNKRQDEIQKGEFTHIDCNIELLPGSHLLVPLEWGLDSRSHQKKFQLYEGFEEHSKHELLGRWYIGRIPKKKTLEDDFLKILSKKVGRGGVFNLPPERLNPMLTDSFEVTDNVLRSLCAKSEFFENHYTRAAIGTFMDLDSIKVNEEVIKIRRPNDSTKFSMSAYFMYGSCPYLYAYDFERDYWKNCGTILNGHQSPELAGDFTLCLGSKVSAIRVEEQDLEITYINKLSVIVWDKKADSRTSFHIVESSDSESTVKIEQGDFLEVKFSDYLEDDKYFYDESFVFYLEISGYYEILVPPPH